MNQRFCLRWNNHQSNLLSVFDQLLHAETFTDVTLAVDGQLLKAHKMVLSACSPYFQSLFVNHQEKHPIVILKDVPYSDMKSLLDFMYKGEVSVDQERLTAFLRVAESLRIKGLTEVNEDKNDVPATGPPPQLHRLHRNVNNVQQNHPGLIPQQQQNANLQHHPLFAGMQPKRKRGRPRKLSGGDDPMDGQGQQRDSSAQRNSAEPERLEVALGAEGFQGGEDQASGDEEALLIDEGDEQPPGSPQNLSDTQGLTRYLLDEDHPNATPVITLELLSRSGTITNSIQTREGQNGSESETVQRPTLILDSNSGVHFLTDDQANSLFSPKLEPNPLLDSEENEDLLTLSPPRSKQELLEYLIRGDGSVVCKLCGEILQSRTHWYRHKYKFHVTPNASPAPLFRCEQCSVYFKSRKGYIGHLASRHPENSENTSEYTSTEQTESILENNPIAMPGNIAIKQEPLDAELAIPRCEVPNSNYNNNCNSSKGSGGTGGGIGVCSNPAMPNIVMNPAGVIRNETKARSKNTKGSDSEVGGVEWEKQRRREERLVADIIARVRRECEESGGQQATSRRGYSRRSALTNG